MKKALLVFNPKSGRGDFARSLYKVIAIFTRAGYEVTVYPTAASGDAKDYILKRGDGFELVVCSGGDGMISEAVNAYMQMDKPPPLGYIPTGTTNDFAMSLGIPRGIMDAAEAILDGSARAIDVGRFGEQHFSYVAAFGKFTDVPYTTNQKAKKHLGRTAYIFESLKNLGDITPINCTLKIDGEVIAGDFVAGVVANVTTVAGFRVPSETESAFDDGLFETFFVRPPENLAELSNIIAGLSGSLAEKELIIRRTAKKIEFTSERGIPCGWTVDGEFGGEHTKITVENIHRAVKIILPPPEKILE
jgi:YegS/Rv2252/BmrU family lipid kinase